MTAAALPLLLGLGVWQLQRAEWKAGVLAELERNRAAPVMDLGVGPIPDGAPAFRRVWLLVDCPPQSGEARAGRDRRGRAGYSIILQCASGGAPLRLDAGWSPRPDPGATWALRQTRIEGVLVPAARGDAQWLLVMGDGLDGLSASAPPSVETISNNHRGYAIQWFSFAAILVAVYAAWLVRWRRQR